MHPQIHLLLGNAPRFVLGRDCLRALFRKQFPPPLTWIIFFYPDMGLKWVKSGLRPTFDPFLHPKAHFWTHFSPLTKSHLNRMRLFCLQFEASCLQLSFFYLQLTALAFFTYKWSSFAYSFSFFTYSWSFFAYSGKVRIIRALTDCKQRSLTVSKKAPTVSRKASPF